MLAFPDDLLYSREHAWVRIDGNMATIGITDYAQENLYEIISIEYLQNESYIRQGEPFGFIESDEGVIEVISPVSGEIINVNDDLLDDVENINSDPYDTGWLIMVYLEDLSELDNLLDWIEYSDYASEEKKDLE